MIEYSNISDDDLEGMIELYKKYLNDGEYVEQELRRKYAECDYTGVKAVDGGEMAGFASMAKGLDFTYPHPELMERLKDIVDDATVYTGDAVVVREEYRGHGVSHKMFEECYKLMCARNVKYILTELWIYPGGDIPAEDSVLCLGKVVYREYIKDFYKDLNKYGMTCPVCGENCSCSACIELHRTEVE